LHSVLICHKLTAFKSIGTFALSCAGEIGALCGSIETSIFSLSAVLRARRGAKAAAFAVHYHILSVNLGRLDSSLMNAHRLEHIMWKNQDLNCRHG
jgi:hypothetical protein